MAKRVKHGGRVKGTPNKLGASAKDSLARAFDKLGGIERLVAWAQENETEFYRIWSKLLPLEVTGEGGEPLKMVIVTGVPPQELPPQEQEARFRNIDE